MEGILPVNVEPVFAGGVRSRVPVGECFCAGLSSTGPLQAPHTRLRTLNAEPRNPRRSLRHRSTARPFSSESVARNLFQPLQSPEFRGRQVRFGGYGLVAYTALCGNPVVWMCQFLALALSPVGCAPASPALPKPKVVALTAVQDKDGYLSPALPSNSWSLPCWHVICKYHCR